jgi:hypothetical protein
VAESLEIEDSDVYELFLEREWTDGLPVIAPTAARVAAMLAAGCHDPDEVVGTVPERSRSVTAEKVAINAVMAGCAPAYFPVVIAAASAALDPAFNLNTVVSSTGGPAICVVVSGPLAARIGMNGGHNALGPGNRANATIGRALRLLVRNVLGARVGEMDGSSLGHPGKYTLCLAEDPPPPPWAPVRADLGYDAADTTVTVIATEGPQQIANHLNGDADGIIRTFAAAMRNPAQFAVGKGGQGLVILGPEHAHAIIEGGWTRRQVQAALWERSRIRPEELEAAGVIIERGAQHDMTPDAQGRLNSMATPDDIIVITAGGAGGGWSAYLPVWAPIQHSRFVTRRVATIDGGVPT